MGNILTCCKSNRNRNFGDEKETIKNNLLPIQRTEDGKFLQYVYFLKITQMFTL